MRNPMHIDICIGYISENLDIVQLCTLIRIVPHHINICKDTVIKLLTSHIKNIGTDTYIWNQLACKTEYSYYQFKKRNWPVKKGHNISWQIIAKKIGLVNKIYPGDAAKVQNRLFDKDNNKDIGDEEKELDVGSDLDEDDDEDAADVNILAALNDKAKHVKRAEKLRKLRTESNYATYGIPDIKEISNKIGFTKDNVVVIYDAAIELGQTQLAILYACRLFVSRKYFHLALKNAPFMKRIASSMEENPRMYTLIKYVMSYSFYMLHKEERLLGRKITSNNRSIMDEDEFRALPVFGGELEESPYCTEIFHDRTNDGYYREYVPMHLNGKREFTSRHEFIKRLTTISGNMLDNIDLSEHGAFLTGSSLVPCVVTNPLEENFKHERDPFAVFLEHYYPSYDSLVIYKDMFADAKESLIASFDIKYADNTSIDKSYQYIENCDEFVENVVNMSKDINNNFDDDMQKKVDAVSIAFSTLLQMEKGLADLDIAIVANTRQDYDEKVIKIFEKIKSNINKKGTGPKYHVYLYKQPLKFGFKWVLKGPGAKRPIDFFKINVPVHALLFRFHLNIVRFWWDGRKVRGLGSGICAALTGVNQWYRWFSNNKDPMSITLKNMARGYTLLLNFREFEVLKVYVTEVDKYKYIAGKLYIGKIHRHHTIFGHEGGIRYQFPDIPPICDQYNDASQYWSIPNYILKRVGCSLVTNAYGKIIPPKIYAFESIIHDLLD